MDSKRSIWKDVILVFLSVALIVVIVLEINVFLAKGSERGIFGDQFGLSNAVFSGLAFAGVIAAWIFQHRDIQAQIQEMKGNAETQKSIALISKYTTLLAATENRLSISRNSIIDQLSFLDSINALIGAKKLDISEYELDIVENQKAFLQELTVLMANLDTRLNRQQENMESQSIIANVKKCQQLIEHLVPAMNIHESLLLDYKKYTKKLEEINIPDE